MSSVADKKLMDRIYASEDRSKTPKEYFKFMVELTRKHIDTNKDNMSILDIGCAGGDFLYYLNECFPHAQLHGMDISEALIEASKTKVANVDYMLADINSPSFVAQDTYDVVYLAGVHLLFDSCEQWIANIHKLLKKDGVLIIFGHFNPLPYDVIVKVRKSGDDVTTQNTWNCFSRETFAREFDKHNCKSEFVHWSVPITIPFNAADPLRTWTTPMADGTVMVCNATRIIHDFYCGIIRKN